MARPLNGNHPAWYRFVVWGFVSIIVLFSAGWLWLTLAQFTSTSYSYVESATQSMANSLSTLIENHRSDESISDLMADALGGSDYHAYLVDENLLIVGDSSGNSVGKTFDVSAPGIPSFLEGGTGVSRGGTGSGGTEQILTVQRCQYGNGQCYLLVSTENRTLADSLTANQAVGLGILLAIVLASSLIAYIAYRFAFNAVQIKLITQAKFVANASHELKTPITGIKLLSESILRAIDQDKLYRISECAEKIDQDCNHLQGIVMSLIETARSQTSIDAVKRDYDYHLVNVVDATRQSFTSHEELARNKGLRYTLDVELPENAYYLIRVPLPSSTAIADNLIENAIQYTSNGSVHVSLKGSGANVIFSVSDTGPGMTEREQEMVFERHYRARRTQSLNPNGSGLGLALVKEAVRSSNGTITLTSEPDKGSTFTVSIPVATTNNSAAIQ